MGERLAEGTALAAVGDLAFELGQGALALPARHAVTRGADQLFQPDGHQAPASSLVRFT